VPPRKTLLVGDVINDILVETAAPIVAGQDNPAAIRARAGGSAANQAAWLGWMGADVTFAGRVGAADVEFHQAELARFGVLAHLAADAAAATGSIVVLVAADGERTMITDRGANLRLTAADVPAALLDDIALLHLTGYTFFEPGPREVALGLIARARRRGVPYTVDSGSAAFLARLEPGAFLRWTSGAAACFANRDEAAVLAGTAQVGDAAEAAVFLARHYGAVVVKLGADGALLATAGADPEHFAAHPATVRDTTGAGDAFCAGFLAAWLSGGDCPGGGNSRPGDVLMAAGDHAARGGLATAVQAGMRAAAVAVSVLGGRPDPGDAAGDGGATWTP
jgi:sugar/nucleoside kinase (ribokinase family)